MDVYQVKETTNEDDSLHIEYTRPKLLHRILANLIDIFIMAVLTFSLFLGVRGIVQATPYYKGVQSRISDIQLNCGLYRVAYDKDAKAYTLTITKYIDEYRKDAPWHNEFDGVNLDDPSEEPRGKIGLATRAINTFISFCETNSSAERYQELVAYYDSYRLDARLDGKPLYVRDENNNIVLNNEVSSDAKNRSAYYELIYSPFIDDRCFPFLASNVPEYRKLTRIDFNFLVFLEIPVAYGLAGFLTFFVPPLFFRRGRQTLGKALYRIGLIDSRILSPTFPRFLARFAIFFFGELVLSLFTFGIPYIISTSLMIFSKNKQGFPDYMLGLIEVDTSKANIYLNYIEAQLKNELHGEAVDFKMKKPL